jgi:hypothetical protein
MGINHGRPQLADDPADNPDCRITLADPGVLQVLQVQLRADDPGRPLRLGRPGVLLAPAGAAAQGQDRDIVTHLPVGDQGAAGADLDVIRMRADGQHDLMRGPPGGAPLGDQGGDHRHQPGRA